MSRGLAIRSTSRTGAGDWIQGGRAPARGGRHQTLPLPGGTPASRAGGGLVTHRRLRSGIGTLEEAQTEREGPSSIGCTSHGVSSELGPGSEVLVPNSHPTRNREPVLGRVHGVSLGPNTGELETPAGQGLWRQLPRALAPASLLHMWSATGSGDGPPGTSRHMLLPLCCAWASVRQHRATLPWLLRLGLSPAVQGDVALSAAPGPQSGSTGRRCPGYCVWASVRRYRVTLPFQLRLGLCPAAPGDVALATASGPQSGGTG
jgi:hypothetical protein